MRSAHQQEIGFAGAPSMGPGVEVVDVAPARGAIASREPATLVGEHHAPPQWRRHGAHGAPKVERVAGFVHHHRGERGVVGDALHRLRRDRVAAQQLAGGRPRLSAQPLQAGGHDQVRPLAAGAADHASAFEHLSGEIDQRVSPALGRGCGGRPWTAAQAPPPAPCRDRPLIQPTIHDPHPVRPLAQVQPAPLVGPGLVGEEGLPVELARQAIGELPQPAGVELSGRLHRPLLQLRGRFRAHALRGAGDHRRLAKAELTIGKCPGHQRQLGQLGRHLDPLRRRPA
jgi:hypothetical protein